MSEAGIRCIVVEDSPVLNRDLVYFLNRNGMRAVGVFDGQELDQHMANHACDVVIVDLGLPGEDGLSIAQRLSQKSNLGLVILTARDSLADRLQGWNSGAHVYLVKPVPEAEVAAVVTSVYRHLNPKPDQALLPWHLCLVRGELLTPDGAIIPLTPREQLLLESLAKSADNSVPRDMALGVDTGASMDALVYRLRRKLKTHGDPLHSRYGGNLVFSGDLKLMQADDKS